MPQEGDSHGDPKQMGGVFITRTPQPDANIPVEPQRQGEAADDDPPNPRTLTQERHPRQPLMPFSLEKS